LEFKSSGERQQHRLVIKMFCSYIAWKFRNKILYKPVLALE